MTYKLSLIATSDAQADGVSVNTATATLMQDNTYPSGKKILFTITGSAIFLNGQQQTTGITGSTGAISVSFKNDTAETVAIFAALQTDLSVTASAQSNFKGASSDDNELSLGVIMNNAVADGEQKNQVQALVRSKNSLLPVPDVTCSFSVSGDALFDNGGKSFTGVTNNEGSCFAYLTSTVAESVAVTVTIPGNQTQTETLTFSAGEGLKIDEVSTLYDKKFSPGSPTVAWIGAQFRILVSGGNGSINWTVSDSGLAVQKVLENGVILQFTDIATTSTNYTITGTDQSGKTVSYSFTLEDYYVSFGSEALIETLYIEGDTKYLPSPNQLHELYSQWGTMSAFPGWTEKTSKYWTNDFTIFTTATLVDVSTNQESVIFFDPVFLCGFAKLKI